MYNLTFDLAPVMEYIAPVLLGLGIFLALWILGMVLAMFVTTRN